MSIVSEFNYLIFSEKKSFNIHIEICKILIILFVISIYSRNSAYAYSEIKVLSQGTPIKFEDVIIQNIIVSIKADSNWTLTVDTFGNSLANLNRPSNQISINDLSIANNVISKIYSFEPNKTMNIDSGTATNTINKIYSIRIPCSDSNYPGIYSGTFKFTLNTGTGAISDIYTLSFAQPSIQKVSILPNSLYIKVLPADAMKKGYNLISATPTRINVQSNIPWKLTIKNQSSQNSLKCKFKVTSVSNNVRTSYGIDYTDLPINELVIAEGNPTANTADNLNAETIEINYLFKTREDEVQSADTYPFNVGYNLIPE